MNIQIYGYMCIGYLFIWVYLDTYKNIWTNDVRKYGYIMYGYIDLWIYGYVDI